MATQTSDDKSDRSRGWRDETSETTTPHFEQRDLREDGLRAICTEIDRVLAQLPASNARSMTGPEDELRAQWHALVTLLALPPARALRECPFCKSSGMLEASRCGHCWRKLPPMPAV